ncbi:ammonium transporter, Amt family [Lachnospiraceae bacterium C10]|jgi:Amt family ammonium transporter|nr:ammonium transporter, Amt family [Lachnospiraceae bacterium C10]
MEIQVSSVAWVLLAAALVYFMQAGFALCEAGLTRAKNTGNILMKNIMDFCIGTPCFWLVGFGLMFGSTAPLIGRIDFFTLGRYTAENSAVPQHIPLWTFVIFQTVFCATASTIVSGSMAERTNFKAYCFYSAAISLLIYPISGHWAWGGGWLSGLGFHDFAGSAVVHNVGGVIACLGASILGPRIGKYGKDGKARAIPGHNLLAMALGVFILWFCWFGFNGGSTVAMSSVDDAITASTAFMTTNLAAAIATVVAMFFTWLRYGKPDVSMTFNAALAGLVAITAGCDCVSPVGAAVIGLVSGILVVFSVEFFDHIAKIDDPVGAISVHMVNGIWGTLAVGLFSNGGDGVEKGLFYGGGLHLLGVQALGIVAIDAYVLVVMFVVFKLIDRFVGLRVPAEIEIEGLDVHEHGLTTAYSGFAISDVTDMELDVNEKMDLGYEADMDDYVPRKGKVRIASASKEETKVSRDEGTYLGESSYSKATEAMKKAAVPVSEELPLDPAFATGMHKVTIICRLSKFDALKKALNELGVSGMTMSQVMGCGIQKGSTERYRGTIVDSTLLPKVKVEVIIGKISVEDVIDASKKALYTGHIGDGKIFVYNVARVVKVRTGEEGIEALQDVE